MEKNNDSRYMAIIKLGNGVGYDDTAHIQLIDKIENDHRYIIHSKPMNFKQSFEKIIQILNEYNVDTVLIENCAVNQILMDKISLDLPHINKVNYKAITRQSI